ncbi:MAG: hypothetical protein HC918_05235 [Oscillatoriales cyanobacterium SM2_1_8]|nr:hypothetical protein [Oscillatoriales cyanobacterium SM2_1_8]
MTAGLQASTLDLLKRFNQAFPQFYDQFVGSDVQLANLKLAYKIHCSQKPVLEILPHEGKSLLQFAYRNQSFLLSDIFGVLTACGLAIHNLTLYGQIRHPRLVFLTISLSRNGQSLSRATAENVIKAIREALLGRFEVEEMLSVEFNLDSGLKNVETNFYVDKVFHLPAILIEADSQPALYYKVMNAIWQEDLLVVNANLLVWRGRTRLIFYLLGPNESTIPEYLGTRLADSLKHRLSPR